MTSSTNKPRLFWRTSHSKWRWFWLVSLITVFGTALALFIAILFFKPIATMTISARTDTAVLWLADNGELTWRLPPGMFIGADFADSEPPSCTKDRDPARADTRDINNVAKSCDSVSLLRVVGAAKITLTAVKDRLVIELQKTKESSGLQASVILKGLDYELKTDRDYLSYTSEPTEDEVFLPSMTNKVSLGSNITEPSYSLASLAGTSQQTLRQGDIRLFAATPSNRRFTVLEEKLLFGDVIDLGETASDVVWSLFVINPSSQQGDSNRKLVINATLQYTGNDHSTYASVTRLGATKSHFVGATWSFLVSKDPRFAQTWAFIVALAMLTSLVIILSEHMNLAVETDDSPESLAVEPTEQIVKIASVPETRHSKKTEPPSESKTATDSKLEAKHELPKP